MSRPMKNSGVEWIGDIPEEWEVSKLKNIIQFINGYAFDSNDLTTEKEGYYVIRIGDFANFGIDMGRANRSTKEILSINKFQIKKDDILIAMSGATVGKLSYVKEISEKAFINQRVGIIRAEKSKFVYFYLNSGEFLKYIFLLASGTAQPNISTSNINNYNIVCPPDEEQHKIAVFLDEKTSLIESIITETKQSISELKKYQQAIIMETITKGLNPDVKMKDSGIEWIGRIPEHWELAKVKYFYDICLGKQLQPEKKSKDDTLESYLRAGNVQWKEIDTEDVKKMWFSPTEKEKYKLEAGDLVVSEGGDAGRAGIWNGQLNECFIQNAVHRVRGRNNRFLYYWLFALKGIGYIDLICNKATLMHFTVDKFKDLIFLKVDEKEQNQIVAFLDEKCIHIDSLISDKETLIREFEDYKKALIYEYVTGKKEVV